MAYLVHVHNRVGKHVAATAAPPASGNANRGVLQPSYSPDTPFSFFEDAYSEYGDEHCISTLDTLTAGSSAIQGLVHLDLAGDTFCETVLSLWDNSWYGIKIMAVHPAASQGSTYESDGYSIHSSAVGSQPGSPTRGIDAFPAANGHSKAAIPDLVHSEAVLAVEQSLGGLPILQAQPSGSDSQTALAQSLTADSGTWKQRQFVMQPPAAEREEAAASGTLPCQMSAARDVGRPARARAHTDDEEAAVAAAWKWRFCRRWKAEQVRVVDPEHASGGSDNMADALLYLNAAGQNNVDLSRTASADLTELRQSLGTAGTVGLLSGECFSESFSATQQPALAGGEHHPHASQQVASVAKQAQKLLQQQRELERKAEERALKQLDASSSWVGDLLPVVEIDDWGKFRFVLVRVKDDSGRNKLILRGRNYAQEDTLTNQLRQQVAELGSRRLVHTAFVELQGSGVMEWRRDRDRHLHLTCTNVYHCTGVSMSPKDLGRVAGVLAKKHLPMHYKVAADGTYVA